MLMSRVEWARTRTQPVPLVEKGVCSVFRLGFELFAYAFRRLVLCNFDGRPADVSPWEGYHGTSTTKRALRNECASYWCCSLVVVLVAVEKSGGLEMTLGQSMYLVRAVPTSAAVFQLYEYQQ